MTADLELGGLSFRLRDLGRDIAFEKGRVELRNDGINLKSGRRGWTARGGLVIGGGGSPGRIALRRLTPTPEIGSVRIPIHGRRLSLRASDSIDLDDLGLDLELAGDPQRGLGISGEVLVASGRYFEDFTVRNMVISPNINESAVAPFYEGKPLLENLALNLRVRTRGRQLHGAEQPGARAAHDLRPAGARDAGPSRASPATSAPPTAVSASSACAASSR